ncbi:UvrD-helicase domain-containing protein [Angustibacter luteus]
MLGLLQYGIRVFVVTPRSVTHSLSDDDYQAFRESRMLECAVVTEAAAVEGCWVVDGQLPSENDAAFSAALQAADATGQINVGQYRIVHADPDANVLVTAGAGTGKTETMSERILFLLATSECSGALDAQRRNLRADDVVLMTFTREAALEMRHRIARTLLLRRRLSRRCVLPVVAWMLQLATAEIGTIHSYAKSLALAGGAAVGFGPESAVSRLTMEFRDLVDQALSRQLADLVTAYSNRQVPASYEWQNHLRQVWDALENNGVPVISYEPDASLADAVDLGGLDGSDLPAQICNAVTSAICEVSRSMSEHALREQVVSTGQLVPLALAALRAQSDPPVRRPRFLFVDEFQDTDSAQMDLIIEVARRLDASLFVVGDAKQGIYRFRGAEGSAFRELERRVRASGMQALRPFSLSTNFRSGPRLLESLHPLFTSWAQDRLLDYSDRDRLRPSNVGSDRSQPLAKRPVRPAQAAAEAAALALEWRETHPQASIAILCRNNWQAVEVQSQVRDRGGACELLVGGSFYTSPAVRELRVLLEAVTQPDAAGPTLELCESRWAAGILAGEPPRGIRARDWTDPVPALLDWQSRLSTLASTGSLDLTDLRPVHDRLRALLDLSRRMPALAWVIECVRSFAPAASVLPGPDDVTERVRYAACLDHLVTLMDLQYQDGSTTLERILAWLKLQIATNRLEDEPVDNDRLLATTTALTVHKAKGLEFDRVLIPYVATSFGPPRRASSRVAVLRKDGELPRLLWEWRVKNPSISNVPNADTRAWADDDLETSREEARLLYVALTRAKDQLTVLVPRQNRPAPPRPDSWLDLINLGSH